MGDWENWQLGNQLTLIRFMGTLALLSVGSYLFAEGLSNLILLPITVAVAGLSGSQEASQVQAWQNQFVIQLTLGILCLVSSPLVAFFKFATVRARVPQSPMATQESFEEVRSRVPRTRIATQESVEEVTTNVPQPTILTQEAVEEIKLRLKKLQFIDSNLARRMWDALPNNIQKEIRDNPGA